MLNAAVRITWTQALAWRMERHLLEPIGGASAVEVARRLSGVQAQVASFAEQAIRVRQDRPRSGEVGQALRSGELIKTWAMRGTLHYLPADAAGAILSVMAAARSWETAAWERYFGMSASQMQALRPVVRDALNGRALTRAELIAEVTRQPGHEHLGDALRSGWGSLLKPLAWQGDICFGPSQGSRVTFARPEQISPYWHPLPDVEESGPRIVLDYLGTYGPATPEHVSAWLSRGIVRRKTMRGWFTTLGTALAEIDVDGEPMYCRAEDADALAAARPSSAVRLLPGFDQWVLGPGTDDPHVIPSGRRTAVSRRAGWIAPVVVFGGVVTGTWALEGSRLKIDWFDPATRPSNRALAAETRRLEVALEREVALTE